MIQQVPDLLRNPHLSQGALTAMRSGVERLRDRARKMGQPMDPADLPESPPPAPPQQHKGTTGEGHDGMVTPLRRTSLSKLENGSFDVLIVGGGINGAVSAAVLAGRGASVALVDRGDFGAFTSQESSNLVWGGFKYLESYEFLLVRKLCVSRNRLIRAYPDNIKPIPFLAALDESSPHPAVAGVRWAAPPTGRSAASRPTTPGISARARSRRRSRSIDTEGVRGGIEYYDAYLKDNDSRFVFSFVRSAMDVGAAAANYVELVDAERTDGGWRATLRDVDGDGREFTCTARMIVNAAGPFIDGLNEGFGLQTEHRIVYSKGIHLIVHRITTNERVLAFFDDTRRLFYVIPMGRRSVIGTTDTRADDPYTEVTDEDREFLLGQINARLDLEQPLTTDDVIAERCGVRPLVVETDGGDQRDVDWTKLSASTRSRSTGPQGDLDLRRQAHRLPQRRRGGRRGGRGTRGAPRGGHPQLVRRARQGDPGTSSTARPG